MDHHQILYGVGRTTSDKPTGRLRWNVGVLEKEMARTEYEGAKATGIEMVWVPVPTVYPLEPIP